VRVDGQIVFNGASPLLQAALNGFGLAYLTLTAFQLALAKYLKVGNYLK
jgi:hypothetical protein